MTVNLIKVGSRLMTDLRLRFANGTEHVLRGTSHPASDGMSVTEGIPADQFEQWLKEHATFDPVASGMIFAVPEGHDTALREKEYGFEPALKRLIEDHDEEELRGRGAPVDEVDTRINPRAGLVVPLPDPIPAPPTEEVHTTPAPSQPPPVPSVEKPQVIPAVAQGTFVPAPAPDFPAQDQTLVPGGTSSVQTGAAPPAPPAPVAAPLPAA